MEKVGEAFVEIGAKQSAGFSGAFKDAARSTSLLSGAFDKLKTAAKIAGGILAGVGIGSLIGTWGALKEKDAEFADQTEETSGALKNLFGVLADVLGPTLKDMMKILEGAIVKLGDWIKSTFEAESVTKFFSDALTFLVAAGIKVWDTLDVMIKAFELLKSAVSNVGNLIVGVFQAIMEWDTEPITKAIKGFEETGEAAKALGDSVVNLFGNSGWERAQEFLGGMRDAARDTASAVKEAHQEAKKLRDLNFMGSEEIYKQAALATMQTSAGNTKVGGGVWEAAIERHIKRQVAVLEEIRDQGRNQLTIGP